MIAVASHDLATYPDSSIGGRATSGAVVQIEDVVAQHVAQLRANGRSEHTALQAARHGALFARWLRAGGGATTVREIKHEAVAAFLCSESVRLTIDGRPRMATSGNAIRSSIRNLLRFAHDAGYAPVNAGRLVKRAQCSPGPPRALSDEDVAKLRAVLSNVVGFEAERDRVLFEVLLRVGLRIGSALGLDVEDLDLTAGEARVRKAKGARELVVYLPDTVGDLLRAHLAGRSTGPVFATKAGRRIGARHAARRLREWARRAGIAGTVSPHRLRHTLGARIYRETQDVLLVREALHHRSVSSTMAYVRAASERVRAALGT